MRVWTLHCHERSIRSQLQCYEYLLKAATRHPHGLGLMSAPYCHAVNARFSDGCAGFLATLSVRTGRKATVTPDAICLRSIAAAREFGPKSCPALPFWCRMILGLPGAE